MSENDFLLVTSSTTLTADSLVSASAARAMGASADVFGESERTPFLPWVSRIVEEALAACESNKIFDNRVGD